MSNYHMCGDDTYITILYCDVAFTYIHVCMLAYSYILNISSIKHHLSSHNAHTVSLYTYAYDAWSPL